MCLESRPSPLTNRPTSAALSVLNLSDTPDSGSNVFKVRTALGIFGALAATSFSSPSEFAFRFCAFWNFADSRFGTLYFVVIRVCDNISLLACKAAVELTYGRWTGLEK